MFSPLCSTSTAKPLLQRYRLTDFQNDFSVSSQRLCASDFVLEQKVRLRRSDWVKLYITF